MYKLFSGKLFRNKKAMQLSINFIVMLIIGIAIFGFGIRFMAQFFKGAQKIKTQLDSQTQAEIETLLSQGNKRVAVPLNTKTIAVGKNDIFGLGILNVLSETDSDDFFVKVGCDDEKIKVLYDQSHTIKNNEKKVVSILIEPKSGTAVGQTHICNICVTKNQALTGCSSLPYFDCCSRTTDKSKLYDGTIHKFYVKLP